MTQYSNRPDREDISGEAFEPFEYVEEVVEYRDTSRLRIVLGIILAILLLLLTSSI